jgi:hypothetical protein
LEQDWAFSSGIRTVFKLTSHHHIILATLVSTIASIASTIIFFLLVHTLKIKKERKKSSAKNGMNEGRKEETHTFNSFRFHHLIITASHCISQTRSTTRHSSVSCTHSRPHRAPRSYLTQNHSMPYSHSLPSTCKSCQPQNTTNGYPSSLKFSPHYSPH